MKLFIKKSAAFIFTTYLIACLFQFTIDRGLKKSNYSASYKEWYNLYHSNINADILIQGSSRARLHVSPLAFEKAFKHSTYNMGIDASYFPIENYMFYEYIRYNQKPRYIIQSIDVGIFTNPNEQFDFKQFIPYLNKNFFDAFKNHNVFTLNDLYIPLYKYTHSEGLAKIGFENLLNKMPPDNGRYNGFNSLNLHYDNRLLVKRLEEYPNGYKAKINDTVYNEFISFIKFCKKENIKLILIYTPVLSTFQNTLINKDSIINEYGKTAMRFKLPFLNYSNDKMCHDTSMFFDFYHLNSKGVKIFNEKLINDLHPYIK